jgi:hypothetical protein
MANPSPIPPPEDSEDIIAQDESLIGRGIQRSLVVLVTLAILGVMAYWYLRPRKTDGPTQLTKISAPTAQATPRATVPKVPFTDITAAAGITFRHENGAYGDKLLPETMGGGVAFVDFDSDGDPDLLFVNSTWWPWKRPDGASGNPPTAALYRNDTTNGQSRFTEVTQGSGLDIPLYGMGVAVGDYDNDGRPDLYLTGVGGGRLFHNEGNGKFAEKTVATGVGGDSRDWSTASTWLDIDNDGDLDLFVANYVRWSREIDSEVGYKLTGGARAYGPPMNFEGSLPQLYRNNGDGTFSNQSDKSGLHVRNPATRLPAAKTLGVAPIDINHDGWMDLVVANDTVQNFVFTNRHDGTFAEIGALTGLAFDSAGATRGAMGIDAATLTRDGKLAFAIGNFANEMTALYVEQNASTPASPQYADEAIPWQIGGPSRDPLKFGVFFFDYDLDGRLDLLTCNGHLEEEIGKIQHGQNYAQAAQLYWNAGDAGFIAVTAGDSGPDLFKPIVGRGSASADIDGDGDLDVVFTALRGNPVLLRNDRPAGHHWLRVKLIGSKSNRDAVGAVVTIRAAGQTHTRHVTPTRSYLSQSESTLTFGLGTATTIESMEILWPGQKSQSIQPPPVDKLAIIEQPR